MKKITEELAEIERTLRADPENSRLWMEHGVGLHLLGEYERATGSFRRSLESGEETAACHFNMANSCMEIGRIEQAIDHYLQAIELQPDHIPSLNNLADAWEEAGEPEKAGEIFRYLTGLNSGDPLSHFNLGNFLIRNNRHTEAAGCYKKAVTIDPSFGDAWHNIAWILKEVGAREEAIHYAKKGVAADPENEDLQSLLQNLQNET